MENSVNVNGTVGGPGYGVKDGGGAGKWDGAVNRTPIEVRFGGYKEPTEETRPRYTAIQQATLYLAQTINEFAPECPEKSSALTALQSARFFANAAIANYAE